MSANVFNQASLVRAARSQKRHKVSLALVVWINSGMGSSLTLNWTLKHHSPMWKILWIFVVYLLFLQLNTACDFGA